jgi:hypothetical protein
MYYIKDRDVCVVPRGGSMDGATKAATTGLDMDYSRYRYYLDDDGDLARETRKGRIAMRKSAPRELPTDIKNSSRAGDADPSGRRRA